MGRRSYSNRLFADGSHKISISDLKRTGFLNGFKKGVVGWDDDFGMKLGSIGIAVKATEDGGYVRFLYKQTDEYGSAEKFDYIADLTTTPCYYGRQRYWFNCPLRTSHRYCGKRVGKLYLVGKYFGCRHCYDLTYKSRQWNKRSRFYSWCQSQNSEEELNRLLMNPKRSYYAARPTKNQLRIWRLETTLGYGNMVDFHGLNIPI